MLWLVSVIYVIFIEIIAGQHYDYTIDCATNSKPSGYTIKNSCSPEGDWSKIIHRPLPDWYADMKFGIFIHWGVYSVPSFGNEWYWHNVHCGNKKVKDFQDKNFGKNWTYPQFSPMFRAEFFDASAWVKTFKESGAQYILPVAKHHDGFCMWNGTETCSGWNAVEVGPKRDVLTELYDAATSQGLDFGIYYSQFEWFNSMYVRDYKSNFTTTEFIKNKVIPQRLDLVNRYPKAILWHTDGGWMAPDWYWGNLDWLTWVYNKSPLKNHVVTCNSVGFGCCQQIGKKCWEYGDAPSGGDRTTAGEVVPHFYTNQMTIQKGSWSYDRGEPLADFLSTQQLITELVQTAAWNGTLVMNVGPTADGRILPIFEERLGDIGKWLKVNGKAIYSTRPWPGSLPTGSEGTSIYYTYNTKTDIVYCICLQYPDKNILDLHLPTPSSDTKATLLWNNATLKWTKTTPGMRITLPPPPFGSQWAWVISLTKLQY